MSMAFLRFNSPLAHNSPRSMTWGFAFGAFGGRSSFGDSTAFLDDVVAQEVLQGIELVHLCALGWPHSPPPVQSSREDTGHIEWLCLSSERD